MVKLLMSVVSNVAATLMTTCSQERVPMNSWDLFDTLVGGRDISVPCGDQPDGNHFPILENVLKVHPTDVIVSDFYDEAKAERILTTVASLRNRLYVGNGIKLNGKIWRQVPVESHTGDQPYEIAGARRAGIGANLVQLCQLTDCERELFDAGFRGLALTIREARLVSYHKEHRELQLLQNQANFPFLFLASLLLHRKVKVQGITRVLMCSRDACLWIGLQKRLRDLCANADYDVAYFHTSRLTRYFPSDNVLKYAEKLVTNDSLIVDVSGSGQSLARFVKQLSVRPDLWLLVGYVEARIGSFAPVSYAIEWFGTTAVELANLATHPMVSDIRFDANNQAIPVFVNPAGVGWSDIPQINAMHEAFKLAVSVMDNYDFAQDLNVETPLLLCMLRNLLKRIDERNDILTEFAGPFFEMEEQDTRETLMSQAERLAL